MIRQPDRLEPDADTPQSASRLHSAPRRPTVAETAADNALAATPTSGLWKDPQNIAQSPKKSVVTAGTTVTSANVGSTSGGGGSGGGGLKVKMFREGRRPNYFISRVSAGNLCQVRRTGTDYR